MATNEHQSHDLFEPTCTRCNEEQFGTEQEAAEEARGSGTGFIDLISGMAGVNPEYVEGLMRSVQGNISKGLPHTAGIPSEHYEAARAEYLEELEQEVAEEARPRTLEELHDTFYDVLTDVVFGAYMYLSEGEKARVRDRYHRARGCAGVRVRTSTSYGQPVEEALEEVFEGALEDMIRERQPLRRVEIDEFEDRYAFVGRDAKSLELATEFHRAVQNGKISLFLKPTE